MTAAHGSCTAACRLEQLHFELALAAASAVARRKDARAASAVTTKEVTDASEIVRRKLRLQAACVTIGLFPHNPVAIGKARRLASDFRQDSRAVFVRG